eukprot:4426828-Pleurochrysis_carterae.AAC.1
MRACACARARARVQSHQAPRGASPVLATRPCAARGTRALDPFHASALTLAEQLAASRGGRWSAAPVRDNGTCA